MIILSLWGGCLAGARSFSWWRENPVVYKTNLVKFQLSSDEVDSIAKIVCIERSNVNTYLRFILEEKKAERRC